MKLINYDKDISMLMTNKWPSWYRGDPSADHNVVLGQILNDIASFNTGLGITYSHNILNQPSTMETPALENESGHRAPDTELAMPCTFQSIRLHRVTRNTGKFSIMIFAGTVGPASSTSLKKLSGYLAAHPGLASHEAIAWITVPALAGCSTYETVGMDPFGDTYYDRDGSTHSRYEIPDEGGVVVIRPDGIVAFRCAIDGEQIRNYFGKVLCNV